MKILLVSSQDYIHHPVLSRHHNIFEDMSYRHEIYTAHFHVSRSVTRYTNTVIKECTLFPFTSPLLHYTLNSPYHYYILNKIIREEKIDVVVAGNVLAASAAIYSAHRNDIPILFDLKDWFPDSAAAYFKNPILKKLVHDIVLLITKHNLDKCDEISTVSPSLVNRLKMLGYNARLITNGVDTEIFKPKVINRVSLGLGLSDNDFVIGYAGSIERWYDIRSLIINMGGLLKYNSNIKLLLVGGSLFTDYEMELRQLVIDMNLHGKVIFTGIIPYRELPKYINVMDVCTMPVDMSAWGDIALPNKYFEYTACGKPIVMTPMPNVEKICGNNVFIFRNNEEYISHIKFIMNEKRSYTCDVSKHSWKQKSIEMEKLLQELILENETVKLFKQSIDNGE